MGFKLPGKSVQSGTSAHRSALKMKAEADVPTERQANMRAQKAANEAGSKLPTADPMRKKMFDKADKLSTERTKRNRAGDPMKMIEASPAKASEFGAEYRKNRDAGKKYFTYKGKEYTTESRSEKAKREESGKTYAELNPKKSRSMTKTLTDKPAGEAGPESEKVTIGKVTGKANDDAVRTSGKNQNASKIDDTEKESNTDVAKSKLRDTKKQNKINTLKGKKDVADAKGKTKKSERLARKIERKETGKTRKEQRQERRKEEGGEGESPATYANAPTKKHKAYKK